MDDSGHARVKEYYENGHFKSRTNYVTRMVTLADGMIETLDKPKPLDTVPAKTVTVVQHAAEFPGGYYGMDFLFEPKPAYTPPFNRHRRSKYQRHSCG